MKLFQLWTLFSFSVASSLANCGNLHPRFWGGRISTTTSRRLLKEQDWVAAAAGSSTFGIGGGDAASSSSSRFATTIPRGGGLFGGSKNDKKLEGTDPDNNSPQKYPAMTKEEIEDWLEHIPVFAVTDMNGAGVVLRPENDTSVFYFFLNPNQANATLTQLKTANAEMDLRVSAFSLGKIWFNLLQSDREVVLKSTEEGGETTTTTTTNSVEYRLVPDTRDLLGARMLLTMSPEDGEKLKESGGTMTPELAQAAIKKAMEESPKFRNTFNEIPVFTIAQMRMQKQTTAEGEEPITLLPMYFSMQNMVATWQEFMKKAPAEIQNVEPAINLMSLHDLIDMMQKESEIDWRHVVLVPLATIPMGNSNDGSSSSDVASLGGATLGDD